MTARRVALAFLASFLFAATAHAQGVLMPTDRSVEPLAIRYHRVDVTVTNGTAVTKLEQVFRNHTPRVLEATYVFPLPKDAALIDFALWMNGKRVQGQVLDRGQARAVYEDIVRRMRDPGLIEWMGNNLFQARVFPIPANGDQKVEISFTQVLPYEDGVFRYVYPLNTGGKAARTLEDFTIQARIFSATPIRNVYSPTHQIYVNRKSEHDATVGFEKEGALLAKDFVLLYGVSQKDIGLNLLTYREPGQPGYFMLMAAPKATWAESEIAGKTVTLVVDTSGSMAGEKMDRARAALRYCAERLTDRDRFNIIRFSSDVEPFRPSPVPAGGDNRRAALQFIEQLEPAGGTAIHEALMLALRQDGGANHMILFITDGRPTVGETETERIVSAVKAENRTGARIFVFGIGDTLNTHLLDRISNDHRGVSSYVAPDKEIEAEITSLFNKLSYPVLSRVELQLQNVATYGLLPQRIPDLFRGDELLVLGRFRTSGDALVRLTGDMGGQRRTYDYEGTFPDKTDGRYAYIASLWANRQVGYLLDEIRLRGERPELVDEVKQLALKFGIVTPYTSYLVVEETEAWRLNQQPPAPSPDRPLMPRGGTGWGSAGRMGDAERSAGSAPAAPATAAPAESARPYYARPKVAAGLANDRALREESGEDAVRGAKAIQHLKEQKVDTSATAAVRRVNDKVFAMKEGRWLDQAYKPGLREVRVKYLSAGYFQLLGLVPALQPYLALGTQVSVVWKGVLLVVAESGPETLSASDLKALQ